MTDFSSYYKAATGFDPLPWQADLADLVKTSGEWPDLVDIPTAGAKTGLLILAAWLSEQGLAPRRLWWVIDRRIVVDQVADLARQLSGWEVITLRGGVMPAPIEPCKRTIIATTVDQLGSRMLWQAYGQSRRSVPIHAGLALNDSMVFLDEAHLSRPFADVLRFKDVPCVELTATPSKSGDVFRLDADRLGALQDRMNRPKHLVVGSHPVPQEAKALAKDHKVIGVILNTAVEARKVWNTLNKTRDTDVILITGKQRQWERGELLEEWLPLIRSGRDKDPSRPVFVVATSAIEVGADLDFDALVTECPAQDALYQRLGRLNRIGRLPEATAVISKPKPPSKLLYGDAAMKTWEWLFAEPLAPVQTYCSPPIPGAHSVWIACMPPSTVTTITLPEIPDGRRTPVIAAPVLTESLCDTLRLCRREIGPFLHGWRDDHDVQLVWRGDLPEDATLWRSLIELCPPAPGEQLSLPLRTAEKWLEDRPRLLWNSENDRDKLRPGDVIVIPSSYGGMDAFGWNDSEKEPVRDVAELVERRRSVTRFPGEELTDAEASERLGQPVKTRQLDNYTVAFVPNQFRYVDQPLEDHTRDVIEGLESIIADDMVNLDDANALRAAAEWHDQGKAHSRWQEAAHGHPFGKTVLGKTKHLRVQLLRGFRHDAESARMAAEAGQSELVQSLVATHHGRDIAAWYETIISISNPDRWAYLSAILRIADQHAEAP